MSWTSVTRICTSRVSVGLTAETPGHQPEEEMHYIDNWVVELMDDRGRLWWQ